MRTTMASCCWMNLKNWESEFPHELQSQARGVNHTILLAGYSMSRENDLEGISRERSISGSIPEIRNGYAICVEDQNRYTKLELPTQAK